MVSKQNIKAAAMVARRSMCFGVGSPDVRRLSGPLGKEG